VKEFWKSVNIWGSYGQEFSVLFFWLTVYMLCIRCGRTSGTGAHFQHRASDKSITSLIRSTLTQLMFYGTDYYWWKKVLVFKSRAAARHMTLDLWGESRRSGVVVIARWVLSVLSLSAAVCDWLILVACLWGSFNARRPRITTLDKAAPCPSCVDSAALITGSVFRSSCFFPN